MTVFVQAGLDLQQHLVTKADYMLKKKMKMQPHVVVLTPDGSPFSDNCTYYAAIHSGVYFETTTLLEAVDICLKSTFVFALAYPPSSRSSWTYLQHAVYGISSTYDR